MSDVAVQHRPRRSRPPDPAEAFLRLQWWTAWHPLGDDRLLRLEEEMADGRYVVRA